MTERNTRLNNNSKDALVVAQEFWRNQFPEKADCAQGDSQFWAVVNHLRREGNIPDLRTLIITADDSFLAESYRLDQSHKENWG